LPNNPIGVLTGYAKYAAAYPAFLLVAHQNKKYTRLKCQNLIFLISSTIHKFSKHELACQHNYIIDLKVKMYFSYSDCLDFHIVTLYNDELPLKASIILLHCYSCSIS